MAVVDMASASGAVAEGRGQKKKKMTGTGRTGADLHSWSSSETLLVVRKVYVVVFVVVVLWVLLKKLPHYSHSNQFHFLFVPPGI